MVRREVPDWLWFLKDSSLDPGTYAIQDKIAHSREFFQRHVFRIHFSQGRNKLRNRIEAARARYLPLLWPVRQSGAALEPNDVILTNLMTSY